MTLCLQPGKQNAPADPSSTGHIAPVFAAESVLAARDKLLAAKVPMHDELQHTGDQFAFFQCLDPDGHVIEFAGKPQVVFAPRVPPE